MFDQLGLDVDLPIESDHLGEVSAVMVYHILAGECWNQNITTQYVNTLIFYLNFQYMMKY